MIGIDASRSALAEAASFDSGGELILQDIRSPLPAASMPYAVVLASLSLHYFGWRETGDIVARIHGALREGVLLLCRVNSKNDVNFGAVGYPEIEPDLYRVHARTKRFFDRAAVTELFGAGWETVSISEQTIGRYGRPKVVWEIALEKAGPVRESTT